ncbi:MAG: hypothetical protein M3P51_16190 [Chloroflexota bacterium]|nr:hypothetical protein [Chloroflexota bacterium]
MPECERAAWSGEWEEAMGRAERLRVTLFETSPPMVTNSQLREVRVREIKPQIRALGLYVHGFAEGTPCLAELSSNTVSMYDNLRI